MSGRFKMVYIDGAYDSKAYGAINHFEIPLSGIRGHVIGLPSPSRDRDGIGR